MYFVLAIVLVMLTVGKWVNPVATLALVSKTPEHVFLQGWHRCKGTYYLKIYFRLQDLWASIILKVILNLQGHLYQQDGCATCPSPSNIATPGGVMDIHSGHHLVTFMVSFHYIWCQKWFNTLRLRPNGCHFADNIFKCIFFNENCCKIKNFTEVYSQGSN